MPLPLVRLIATGLCEALSYAHGLVDGKGRPLRVVHRDVTPGNVLVSRNGAVLLTDFGIALARDSSKTEPGVLKGKAAYMAPEQVRLDRRIDARTDIYALAMTLYELLTGTNPYRKPTMKESLAALEHSRLEPVETLRSDVGERMAKALHQALEHDPERRFPTARAFREAFVDGPVATAPDLADFVKFHCVDTPSEPALEDSSGPATRSVVVTVTPAKPPRLTRPDRPRPAAAPAPRRGLVAAAVLALLSLGGGLAWWSSSQTPVPPPAPTAAPLEPPPEEAAPTETPPPHEPAAVPVEPVAAQRPEPKEDPAPRPVRHPRPPPLPAKMRVGYLSADASPWAEVELNGQVLDRTPFARFPVPAGKHQVVFHGPGGKTVTRTVQISEGAVSALRVDF